MTPVIVAAQSQFGFSHIFAGATSVGKVCAPASPVYSHTCATISSSARTPAHTHTSALYYSVVQQAAVPPQTKHSPSYLTLQLYLVYLQNILPRVAAKLDVGMLSEITAVVAEDTFERNLYAGTCWSICV